VSRLGWTCRAAAVATILGVFGTWRTVGPVSLDGLEGPHDGWLVVVFVVVALAGVRSLARGGWLGIATVGGGAAAAGFTAVSNLLDDADGLGGSSGWGVWLTIAGATVLVGAALAAAAERLRARAVPGQT